MLAGGACLSWLVLMPAIMFFGSSPGGAAVSGHDPDCNQMESERDLWKTYVRPMGAGAVAASGIDHTAAARLPTICGSVADGGAKGFVEDPGLRCDDPVAPGVAANGDARPQRTAHDLPMTCGGGRQSVLLVALLFVFLEFQARAGRACGLCWRTLRQAC